MGRHVRRVQAAAEIIHVLFMDIGLGVALVLAALHPGQRGLQIHIQIDHQIGLGKAHLAVFQIGQPLEIRRQLLITELGALMDGVGSGVTVGNDQTAVFIGLSPVLPEGGKAVHRVKGGGGVGVHIVGMGAELPGEVHADQCAALLVIAGKHNVIIVYSVLFHSFTDAAVLGRFPAAVYPFKDDKLAFAQKFILRSCAIKLRKEFQAA